MKDLEGVTGTMNIPAHESTHKIIARGRRAFLAASTRPSLTHMDGMGWAVQGQPLPHRLWVAHGRLPPLRVHAWAVNYGLRNVNRSD